MNRSKPDAPEVASERLFEIGFVLYTAMDVFMTEVLGMPDENQELSGFRDRLIEWIDWQLSPQAVPSYDCILPAVSEVIQEYPNEFGFKNGCYCITPGRLCQLVQEYCQDSSITEKDITAKLRNANLLNMDKSGKSTKKINGVRYLHINAARL